MVDASLRPNGLLGGLVLEEPRDLVPNGLLGTPSLLVPERDAFVPSGLLRAHVDDTPPVVGDWRPRAGRSDGVIEAKTFDNKVIRFKPRKRRTTLGEDAQPQTTNLLDVPMHRLLDQLTRDALKAEAEQAAAALEDLTTQRDSVPEDQLWVDRYRPKRFTDLLGDERVHRETMAWVKQWDFCVYGTNRRRKRQHDEMEEENNDELQRPRERILLLSGPPGLGKTTLAHVVARQAGYNVLEINASDARTGSVIDDRVRPALESGSAVGSKKPVLVVIDEIDGATGAGDNSGHFVQKLLQLTFEKPVKKGRKKEQGPRPLRRPIICICNDLYASSLAKLRPHARIIRFQKPTDLHLVKRLREICDREGMRPDTRALSTLVGVAQGDMRSCLNALQFIKAKKQELSEAAVRAATKGMKEADMAFSTVLNNLFIPLSKRRVKELGLREDEETRYVSRLSREVEASGAIDKVVTGCFEHYTNLRHQDATLERFEKASEWLCHYDAISGVMRTEREYAMLQYLPYLVVPFFPLFSERGAPKVERPKADWEHYLKTKQNQEIYKSLTRCIQGDSGGAKSSDYRSVLANGILQLEFAPMINRIISPPLRPVNSQVIRPGEKKLLNRLVEIMVALDLRFVQEKSEDGNLVYRLDPPIDVFVTYDGKRAADIAVSRYAVRHLVAAEIDEKTIHRQAELSEATSRPRYMQPHTQHEQEDEPMVEADESAEASGQLIAGGPNKRVRIAEVAKPVQEKGPVDFFGRPIVQSAAKKSKAAAAAAVVRTFPVTYRFNEGNSAAVRKPVKVSSLL